MSDAGPTEDVQAIKTLIGAHFDALRWSPETQADWETFAADFLPDASLFPSARPVRRKTLEAFIARMKAVAEGSLHSFEEKTLGMQILVFGNVAVVLAASEMLGERHGGEPRRKRLFSPQRRGQVAHSRSCLG